MKANTEAKVQKPSAHFDEPRDVVLDATLLNTQKTEALETWEQDARQLADASSEGMAGGEQNRLHDVLTARDMLAGPPIGSAYKTILRDLLARQERRPVVATQALLMLAVFALKRLYDPLHS